MRAKLTSLIILFFAVTFYAQSDPNYLKEGDSYYIKFDNKNALKYYQKAYEINPDYEATLKLTRAYNDLGEEYYELHNRKDAKLNISEAVKLAEKFHKEFPDSADTFAYLALCYGNQAMFEGGKGKIKLAQKVELNAKKAMLMQPKNILPYIIMGIYYREAAKLNWFEKIFANTFLGKVPEGTFEQSKEMLNKARKIDPQAIIPIYQLAKTYRDMGEQQKEIKMLKEVFELPLKNFRDKFAIIRSKRMLSKILN